MKFLRTSLRAFLSVQRTLGAAEKNASAAKPPWVGLQLQASHRLPKENWYTNRDFGVQGSSSQSGTPEEAPSVFQSLSCRSFFLERASQTGNCSLGAIAPITSLRVPTAYFNSDSYSLLLELFSTLPTYLIPHELLLGHSNSLDFLPLPTFASLNTDTPSSNFANKQSVQLQTHTLKLRSPAETPTLPFAIFKSCHLSIDAPTSVVINTYLDHVRLRLRSSTSATAAFFWWNFKLRATSSIVPSTWPGSRRASRTRTRWPLQWRSWRLPWLPSRSL